MTNRLSRLQKLQHVQRDAENDLAAAKGIENPMARARAIEVAMHELRRAAEAIAMEVGIPGMAGEA